MTGGGSGGNAPGRTFSRIGREAQGAQAPFAAGDVNDVFANLGKIFKVTEVVRMNKAGMRDVGKRYPKSEVSARNIPLTSAELRSRLGVKSGDDAHIFGVKIETPFQADNFLLVCHRI